MIAVRLGFVQVMEILESRGNLISLFPGLKSQGESFFLEKVRESHGIILYSIFAL